MRVICNIGRNKEYTTIANDGVPIIPYSISEIKNQNDKILYKKTGSKLDPVFRESSIKDIKELLHSVVVDGTGKIANVADNIYGKTGTSQNFRDAWFVGFDDDLIIGVWIGNDDNSPTQKITGGSLPAELFSMIIKNN